jgi:hypothetical protein
MNIQEIDTAIEALKEARTQLVIQAEAAPNPPVPTVESVYDKILAELEPLLDGHLPVMEDGKAVVRCPKAGEWALTDTQDLYRFVHDFAFPRLILLPRRRLVYPVIGDRMPGTGELYCPGPHLPGRVFRRDTGGIMDDPRLILGKPTLEEY